MGKFERKVRRAKLAEIAKRARKDRPKDQPRLSLRAAMHAVQQAAGISAAAAKRGRPDA